MLRLLLTKYWVLAHLLVMAGTLCFTPSPRAFLAIWGAASLILMAMALPPGRKGETFWMARTRVAGRLRSDVVVWGGLLAVVWTGIGLLNGPRAWAYSAELKRWVYALPPMAFLPSSIELGLGTSFWAGLTAGLAGAVAIRCVLPRSQRLWALLGLGCLTGLLALGALATGVVTGSAPALAWLGGSFDASVLWFLLMCTGMGVAAEAFLEGHWKTLAWAQAVVVANGMGLAAFAPAELLGVAALVLVIYLCFAVVAVRGGGRYPRSLWYCVMLLPALFAAGLGLALAPERTLWPPEQWAHQLEVFFDQWGFRADLALKVMGTEPMLGGGPQALDFMGKLFVKGGRAWALWRAGGTGVPCDLLKLLAERGLMGTLFLLLPGAAMLGKCLMQWVEFHQSVRRHYSMRYIFVFAGCAIGVAGVLLASLIGTPLHTPAVLCAFLIVCATLSGWMPQLR